MRSLEDLRARLARHLALDSTPVAPSAYALLGLDALGFGLAWVLNLVLAGGRGAQPLPSAWLTLSCTGFVLLHARAEPTFATRASLSVLLVVVNAVLPAPLGALAWAVALGLAWASGAGRVAGTMLGLALGGAWYALVVALLPAHRAHGLELLRPVVSALPGVFLALGAELGRVRVTADPLAVELSAVPLVGTEATERWSRLVRAVERLPRTSERRRLWAQAREAAERVADLGRRLAEAEGLYENLDAERARGALAELKQSIDAEADPTTRALLVRAAQVQSDALEQVDGFARQTRRLEASLRAALSVLERIVTHVELTPAHPATLAGTTARIEELLAAEARA